MDWKLFLANNITTILMVVLSFLAILATIKLVGGFCYDIRKDKKNNP